MAFCYDSAFSVATSCGFALYFIGFIHSSICFFIVPQEKFCLVFFGELYTASSLSSFEEATHCKDSIKTIAKAQLLYDAKAGVIFLFLIVNKSHEKTKTNKVLVCVSDLPTRLDPTEVIHL